MMPMTTRSSTNVKAAGPKQRGPLKTRERRQPRRASCISIISIISILQWLEKRFGQQNTSEYHHSATPKATNLKGRRPAPVRSASRRGGGLVVSIHHAITAIATTTLATAHGGRR